MNKFNFYLILCFVVLPICSCNSLDPDTSQGVIQLKDVWNTKGAIMLSEIASSIEYIPLEITNDPASLLPSSSKIKMLMTRDHFLTYSYKSALKVFSRQGSFLQCIGRIGQGPGEYSNINKILATNDEKQLWIFDGIQKKMILYDLDGSLVREFKVDQKTGQVAIDPNGHIYLLQLENDQSIMGSSKIQVVDGEGILINQISLYENRRPGPGKVGQNEIRLNYTNDALEHFEPPYDTVFRYENGSWKPIWVIDLGPDRIPFESYITPLGYLDFLGPYSFIFSELETPDYFFIAVSKNQKFKRILVNKSTLKVQTCDFSNEKAKQLVYYLGLTNDIDGGIPFWPVGVYRDEYLISLIDPIILKGYESAISDASNVTHEHRLKLDDLMEKLNPEGNPIVMLVSLK